MSLNRQLQKASAVFVKAKKQYERLVEECDTEIEVSKTIIKTGEEAIKNASTVKERAVKAIKGIDEIV